MAGQGLDGSSILPNHDIIVRMCVGIISASDLFVNVPFPRLIPVTKNVALAPCSARTSSKSFVYTNGPSS